MTDLLGFDSEIRVNLTLFVEFGKVFVIYMSFKDLTLHFLGLINLSHTQIMKKSLNTILIY